MFLRTQEGKTKDGREESGRNVQLYYLFSGTAFGQFHKVSLANFSHQLIGTNRPEWIRA